MFPFKPLPLPAMLWNMANHVAILENDVDRLLEMKACLDELLPQFEHCFFDNAQEMVAWLGDNLASVVLISLDHDLPIVQYRIGKRVDPGTGRHVAEYLATQPAMCPVIIHSSNMVESEGMIRVLKDANWPHTRVSPYDEYKWVRETWAQQVQAYISQGWIFAAQGRPTGTP